MNDTNASTRPDPSHRADERRVPRLGRTLSALSFWCAIGLPAVYLPLLAVGIETTSGLSTFLLLFSLHVVALVGGRRHRPSWTVGRLLRSSHTGVVRGRPSRRRSPR